MPFDYFTTSDGYRYVVEIKPRRPEWTIAQERLAKRVLVFWGVLCGILITLLSIFIAYVLTYNR